MLQTVRKLKHCIKNNNRVIQNVHAFERTARATLQFNYYLAKGIFTLHSYLY